jgi:hypothetical protein
MAKGRGRGGPDDYWVTKRDDGRWQVKRERAERASGVFDTQRDAAKEGRDLAKKAEVDLVITGEDHKIRSKDSYGGDPPSRKDTEH